MTGAAVSLERSAAVAAEFPKAGASLSWAESAIGRATAFAQGIGSSDDGAQALRRLVMALRYGQSAGPAASQAGMMGKGGAAGREEGEARSTELFCSGLIALFQGDFAGADALFQAIDPAGAARDLHADLIFLGAVAHAHGAPADDRLMARLTTSRGMLARSPARGQPGFESKVLLLDAEIARVSGDRLAALQFYDQAAGIAAGAAIAQEEGLAHELAARLSESSGLHTAALAHRRLARDSFHRWGAHAKAQLLDAGLPYGVSYALDATGPLHPESNPDDPASLVEAARLHAGQSEGRALLARSEASLRCARAELAKTSQLTVMGSLAASIAHEINQPLAVIVSNAGAGLRWLRQSPPNVTEAMASLTVIRDDGLRAGGIIKALRALAKQGPAALEKIGIDDVLRHVLDIMAPELEAKRVSLSLDLQVADDHILGDRVQLQQLMHNLVSNAVEAIDALPLPDRRIQVTSMREGVAVVVRIADSGQGLAREALDQIFDPFYTTKEGGMGMGLVISRSIVEAHGGTLGAASEPGEGTVFEFRIPLMPVVQGGMSSL